MAARCWIAAAQGHVCLGLGAAESEDLAGSMAVTTDPDTRAAPLVRDGGQLYLARLWPA